MQHNIKAQY